ncbi:MAG: response regulator [Candidatus Latescibacteria bacterium]|nr:response regulator [Candidatus Latescibacterota bacterium]
MTARLRDRRSGKVKKQVLIVDDEQSIRTLLDKAFTKDGYDVVLASSAEEALDLLDDHPIQVMFLDLKLPGMNGIELCRRIKKDNPIACIFAMTGYSSLFDLADCRDAGFDDYFLKPLDIAVFLKTARESFEKIARWKKK